MLRLYNTAAVPLRLLAGIWGLLRSGDPGRRREWSERRAVSLPDCAPGGIWIHGSSVGEARLVGLLAAALRRQIPDRSVAVSAFTPTGRERLPRPPDVDAAFFAPLDFSGYPSRIFDALRPALLTLVETELWPNLVLEAKAAGIRVAMVNGRLSPERMGRYGRFAGLYGPVLHCIDSIGAQTQEDAARFIELGVRPEVVEITGNIKYDLPQAESDPSRWRTILGLPDDGAVFVAGSTGAGEEPLVLEAFEQARRRFPRLYLVLAPRHPRRTDEVARLLDQRGLRHVRVSQATEPGTKPAEVLLVDTLGQLGELYGLAHVAFVGGSLVPVGGHNLLEPVGAGAPVLFGPHTEHFDEPARALEAAGAGLRVRDAEDLGRALEELLGDPARRKEMITRGAGVVRSNRGALDRSIDLLLRSVT